VTELSTEVEEEAGRRPPRKGPRGGRRWARWLLRSVLALAALVVLGVAGALVYVQTPAGSARILALGLRAANEAIAGRLSAGSLTLRGGHLVLRDVTLATPDGEKVAHVETLELRISLLRLLGKTVHLSLVRIDRPDLWLAADDAGTNLARAIAPRHPRPAEPSKPGGPLPFTFVVDQLALERGAVRVVQGQGEEARRIAVSGLQIHGLGQYSGPSGAFEGKVTAGGALSGLLAGPLRLAADARHDGHALDGRIDLGLAGLVLQATARQQGDGTEATLQRLVVPPAVGRALVAGWTVKVPLELEGAGGLAGNVGRADLRGRAGSAVLSLSARADVRASTVERGHLELRHVDLSELLADGPASDLALTADVRGGGRSLETLTGSVDLAVPPSRVRGAAVGPVDLHASADRGRYAVRELRAFLPGLRITGSGKGTTRHIDASLDADATDLALLGKTFGSLSASRFPPLAGSGRLHLEATGPLRHPGLAVEGGFPSLRVTDLRVRSLKLSAHVADLDRPLDATAEIEAQQLKLGDRSLRPVAFSLLTRGRALDLHALTGGSLPFELHLGGTADEDRRGLELETVSLSYPEATWTLERPGHLRFGGGRLELEPIRLTADRQAIGVGGWKRGDQLEASVALHSVDLSRMPHALFPQSFPLAGTLTLDARAHGAAGDPSLEATIDAEDVTAGKVQHLFVQGSASWVARRARAQLTARGLHTELSADLDVPVDAIRRRRHEALHARISIPSADLAQVVCAAVDARLLSRGCAGGRAEVTGSAELQLDLSGHGDAPVLQAALRTRAVRFRQLPPTDVALTVDGPPRGNLSVSAQGTALQGTVDLRASVDRSLAQLVSDARPAQALREAGMQARVRIAGLQLRPLRDAGLLPRDVDGAVSLTADLTGKVSAPAGDLRLEAKDLRTPPMDPTDVVVEIKAHQTLAAALRASAAHGPLVNVTAEVGASPASLQARSTFDDVPVRVEGKIGPLDLARTPIVVGGEGRQARRLSGTVEATLAGRGSLQAPTLSVDVRATQLAAGQTPLGKAQLTLGYEQARSRLQAALDSINGGSLRAEATANLDLSYPAIRRGLQPGSAPFSATLTAQRFDLGFLTGYTSLIRKVAGTLDVDARATGTLGKPAGQGRVEWKDGALGLAGYGSFDRLHLLLNASNDRVSLDDLEVHGEAGSLKMNALGTRDGPLWALKAGADAKAFPIFTEDQLLATVTLRTDVDGWVRPGQVELNKIHIPEAHVELPAQSRRNLQSLSRPDDIILLKNGRPLDPKHARAVLARDRTLEASLAGIDVPGDAETKPLKITLVLDATKNLWVKGQDLNVEVGLSPDFRLELAQEAELFGEVRIIRGRLDVMGRRFDFQRNSVVRFSGPPTQPGLNVTALYNDTKAGVKVSMHVQGQAGEITLVPSSEPPLTESEIYTLLATGRTTLKRGSGGSEIGSAQAVSVLGSLAASQLKGAVNDKVGLDVLSVEGGDQGNLIEGATLEAGKYVTDDLYLGYAGKVGADPTKYENSNAVRLEYQFLRRWSFEATYGDAKSGSADIVWTRDY